MYCVGLTGSIASGKSTVASVFASLGIDVISADLIARQLVEPHQPAFFTIQQHFGSQVLTPEGSLNRKALREIIVHDACERKWLEDLLHPLIRQQILNDIQSCHSPYCIIEIPLLTDTTAYPYLDRVLLVKTKPEQQIMRLMMRDNSTREQALAIIATTKADSNKRHAIADDVLLNAGSHQVLQKKIQTLHQDYILKAGAAARP